MWSKFSTDDFTSSPTSITDSPAGIYANNANTEIVLSDPIDLTGAAAAYLKQLPQVNTDRLGLFGGSYGGYLTALGLAKNSDMFKAGVDLNHPNLIGVYDFGDADGMLYIVMELVEGKSLYHSAHGKLIDQSSAAEIVTVPVPPGKPEGDAAGAGFDEASGHQELIESLPASVG